MVVMSAPTSSRPEGHGRTAADEITKAEAQEPAGGRPDGIHTPTRGRRTSPLRENHLHEITSQASHHPLGDARDLRPTSAGQHSQDFGPDAQGP